jgi:hypothetical protein
VGVVFVYLMFLLARYCLAGCELRISPTSVQYRVSLLGISLERRESPTSAVMSIPMNCAGLSRHRIDVRLENRTSWPIELREVAIGDVFWLQRRWAEGLRLPRR